MARGDAYTYGPSVVAFLKDAETSLISLGSHLQAATTQPVRSKPRGKACLPARSSSAQKIWEQHVAENAIEQADSHHDSIRSSGVRKAFLSVEGQLDIQAKALLRLDRRLRALELSARSHMDKTSEKHIAHLQHCNNELVAAVHRSEAGVRRLDDKCVVDHNPIESSLSHHREFEHLEHASAEADPGMGQFTISCEPSNRLARFGASVEVDSLERTGGNRIVSRAVESFSQSKVLQSPLERLTTDIAHVSPSTPRRNSLAQCHNLAAFYCAVPSDTGIVPSSSSLTGFAPLNRRESSDRSFSSSPRLPPDTSDSQIVTGVTVPLVPVGRTTATVSEQADGTTNNINSTISVDAHSTGSRLISSDAIRQSPNSENLQANHTSRGLLRTREAPSHAMSDRFDCVQSQVFRPNTGNLDPVISNSANMDQADIDEFSAQSIAVPKEAVISLAAQHDCGMSASSGDMQSWQCMSNSTASLSPVDHIHLPESVDLSSAGKLDSPGSRIDGAQCVINSPASRNSDHTTNYSPPAAFCDMVQNSPTNRLAAASTSSFMEHQHVRSCSDASPNGTACEAHAPIVHTHQLPQMDLWDDLLAAVGADHITNTVGLSMEATTSVATVAPDVPADITNIGSSPHPTDISSKSSSPSSSSSSGSSHSSVVSSSVSLLLPESATDVVASV